MLHQAGVIAYRVEGGKVEVLLVTSRDTGRWIIPKGNIDSRHTAAEAAQLEAFEEAGVEGEIVGSIPLGFYTYFKRLKSGANRATSVEVYLMRADQQRKKFPEKRERSFAWLPIDEAVECIQEPGVVPILERVAELETGAAGLAGP